VCFFIVVSAWQAMLRMRRKVVRRNMRQVYRLRCAEQEYEGRCL
jgi:hypothetical protein